MTDQMEIGTAVAVPPETTGPPALPDVQTLMAAAVEQGEGGVAALERLVGLQERLLTIEAERALSSALAGFRQECPQIPMTRTAKIATKSGSGYNFTYAPLDTIDSTIRPYLQKWALAYYFDATVEGSQITVTCTVRHELGATISASFTGPTEAASGSSPMQKIGAAHTYAKRQALSSALGLITTTADADDLGSGGSAEPISEDKVRTLREMIDAKGADIDRFLKLFDAGSLKDITDAQYATAVRFLEAKK